MLRWTIRQSIARNILQSISYSPNSLLECCQYAAFAIGYRTGVYRQKRKNARFVIGGFVSKPHIRNIADLAKIAGVSPGTVSRALSDSGMISQKTRDRIKALARDHGFRPNVMARNLRIQKTGAIGVIIPLGHEVRQHISDPFFITMLGLLADELTERGYDLMLSRIIPQDSDWLDIYVDSGRVDGVIVIGQSDQSAVLDAVAARFKPLVVWGTYAAEQVHCSVGTDNIAGGRMATQHVLDHGARRVAFFGDIRGVEMRARLDGCKAALSAAGLLDALDVVPIQLTREDARQAIVDYCDTHADLPDAIVAATDVIAMAAISVLTGRGVRVPDDVRVIGYDDLPLAEQTAPPLSTIRQDLVTGAHNLVDLLLRRIAGEDTASVVMPPELVVRGSS